MNVATVEDIRSLKGIVYGVHDRINNIWYIGQSKRSFHQRYYRYSDWWNYSHNEYLKRAVNKHGIDNFSIYIFEYSVKTLEELNSLEEAYIKQYNSIHPNGYNFNAGGDNSEWSEFSKNKKSKTYILKDIKGNVFTITNGANFCKENGINTGDFWRMLGRKQSFAGDFCLPETDLTTRNCKRNRKPILLKHKDGGVVEIFNLSSFARQHNLSPSLLSALTLGKVKKCGDWFLVDTEINYYTRPKNKRWKRLILVKDGEEFVVENGEAFAKQHGFKSNRLGHLVRNFGKIGRFGPFECKGFILKEIISN